MDSTDDLGRSHRTALCTPLVQASKETSYVLSVSLPDKYLWITLDKSV